MMGLGHTINVPLARKVLEYLEDHPDEHMQRAWARVKGANFDAGYKIDLDAQLPLGECGTAGCFAGWTAAILGHKVGTAGEFAGVVLDLSNVVAEEVDAWNGKEWAIVHDASNIVSASQLAREELGLSEDQARRLFAAENSRADLRQMLSRWTDGEIEPKRLSV